MTDHYCVERNSSDSKKWQITLIATGRQAHGTGAYADKSVADRICASKNASVTENDRRLR
jgi:hypothetical protein